MYSYEWNDTHRGYNLTTQTGKFVAAELRPVFAEELALTGLDRYVSTPDGVYGPLMWAKQKSYIYKGEEIARLKSGDCGESLQIEWKGHSNGKLCPSGRLFIEPVDVYAMLHENRNIMNALVSDTLKRIKEMYDLYIKKCDVAYIGFSGGKDSMLLLDLCHRVLPLDVPVVFSDTDMELPDTYLVWKKVQERYAGRPFLQIRAQVSALENWHRFGPPSQALRWCCSVHKSAPAVIALRERSSKKNFKALAFVGVRGEESLRRSGYDDIGDGLKVSSQVNAMPILGWSSHELWLYTFFHELLINDAYRKGLPRVGCLLCPMSSEHQVSLIRKVYPVAVSPFVEVIRKSFSRDFASDQDAEKFVYSGGWHARKSGVSLQEIIPEPDVEKKTGSITLRCFKDAELNIREWVKAIRKVDTISIDITSDTKSVIVSCVWEDGTTDKKVAKWLNYAAHKAIACVGCEACKAECPTGALEFARNNYHDGVSVRINEALCVHCMRCYAPDEGCFRYYSKRYAGGSTMTISGINKYMTFGLKPDWIEVLDAEQASFRQTKSIGSRMIPSAVTWFRESGLISSESNAIKTTSLLEVGRKRGFQDFFFWMLLWSRLANISPLVKWYVCNAEIGKTYSQANLLEILEQSVSSESVRRGAIQSLCNMLKYSPLGANDPACVTLETKGSSVKSLTRQVVKIDPLITLYTLYVMAEVSERSIFTIRQIIDSTFEQNIVSPIAIFGLSTDELKQHCLGLSNAYPRFISCSFTLGLDEIRLFPKEVGRYDVLQLILDR